MNRRQRLAVLCAILPSIGIAGAAMLLAQETPPAAPDRSVEVNGWRVEDVPEPTEDDPQHRVIRMTRGSEYENLVFTVDVSGYRLEGWGDNGFTANGTHDGRSCWNSGGVMAETGPPEERAGRVRVVLARELGNLERQCGAPQGAMQGRLDGFEGGFALLSAWYGERQAELRAMAEANTELNAMDAAYAYENSAYYDDSMAMDTNMSMDMGAYNETASETNYTNYIADPEAAAALEAATNAAEAAAEAALNAMDAEPE